jgi:ubiquinone/menaquinone biosynthesis C-methylase UbiE
MAVAPPSPTVPNHHGDHPGFSGVGGFVAAFSMLVGRGPTARVAMEATGLSPGERLVDVGCGPGAAARFAARRGAEVAGVEPDAMMLRVGRLVTRRAGTVRLVEGSAESLPLPDASADVVWSLASVHHWADVEAGVAEARRVLVAGGRFLAAERRVQPGATGLASHGWTNEQADQFADLCRLAGFTDVQVSRHQAGRRALWAVRAVAPGAPGQ